MLYAVMTLVFAQVVNWLGYQPTQQARNPEDKVFVDHAFVGPQISFTAGSWNVTRLGPRYVTKCKKGTRCGIGFRGGLISAHNESGIGDMDSTVCEYLDSRMYFDTYASGIVSTPISAIGSWERFADADQPPYLAYRLTFNPNSYCEAWRSGGVIGWSWYPLGIVVHVEAVDNLGPVSDSLCQYCSWPYISYANSAHDGCIVDRTRYQSRDRLVAKCYAYCNTYPGGSQYYIDYSRSNFETGSTITCACSSPVDQSTVRMPTTTCPSGTLEGLVDTAGTQPNDSKDLDTVSRSGGGGGGNGSDSGTHSRLDSILGRLSRSPFVDSLMDSLIRSDSTSRDSVTSWSDSITQVAARMFADHGDTSQSHQWNDDSFFRWVLPMTGIADTSLTTDEFADWLIPLFKGLRAIFLALVGVACFWIYYHIVKGE